jgi:release factor glutamine methyltransferase
MPRPIRLVLQSATERLSAAGNASPRVDAELLLAHVVQTARGRLFAIDHLSEDSARRFDELITRRANGMPLQHLTGRAPFRHLEVVVGPGVFIPRPETELIIDLAADRLQLADLVVDLCAGSGAIALAVANEHRGSRVLAVERSEQALGWLRANSARRVAAGDPPIEVVAADIADIASGQRLSELYGTADVVLANPPYVPELDRRSLPPEIAADPDEAVFAGRDGLALMPALATAAARLLRPDGLAVIEHDDSQGVSLPELLADSGLWSSVNDHPDLTGRSRFVTATRAR